ncbi:hypothetical protein QN277_027476 [Acacia crassicarpa]|uniref:Kinesin motor domain-containing protein n=1 Tax=Acacia crassicarpa TaxID=499986 RepID=A0AAE1JEI0_9FABA|nr:hypothetical protein QN277_027476 [Acacia crassicarpa]
MKHFMLPRNAILRDSPSHELPSSSSPSSYAKPRPSRKQKSSKENDPPLDLNVMQLDSKPSPATAAKVKSPLPPRPPSSNPLKRKLNMDTHHENPILGSSDSGVKVVVRMRPPCQDSNEGDLIVQKTSSDSLSINGQTFTFDSVADPCATQQDIFELVGVPLVENCLAGFNSSVFAYGQTGSGKTYTMWGPANALSEDNSTNDQQGLTPRVFERLFARMIEEQIKHSDKQLNYQCHCSFLEIYNEQITDLLDPNQRNLQIREDVKSGIYVENLTEEQVCTMKDVVRLLLKGLSNRRIGATSINSESSRSHTVFTCVVESRCKSTADGVSRFKSSRINLVDLAGSERQKLTGAAGERLKEAGNINRSLSQLGNLINILAEISQTGKQRHIPYRDSRLTFLLQESLGGNAKLAMVCAISPAQSCRSETFSTLRFAQRAKAIKNKAVVNEVMHDDVNHLREVIRQLRDELHRIKANGFPTDSGGGHSAAWIKRSLNLIQGSINRPPPLPCFDDDGDEEMEIDEEGVDDHAIIFHNANMLNNCNNMEKNDKEVDTGNQDVAEAVDDKSNPSCCGNNMLNEESSSVMLGNGFYSPIGELNNGICAGISASDASCDSPSALMDCVSPDSLNIVQSDVSPVLQSPIPSVSPRVNSSRKSLKTSLTLSASENLHADSNLGTKSMRQKSITTAVSSQTAPNGRTRTEHLAASIRHGLEIIESHRQSAAPRRSSFRFSLRPTESRQLIPVDKVDVGVQTFIEENITDKEFLAFTCNYCKNKMQLDVDETDNSNLQLVPVDCPESADKPKKQILKAVEKVVAGSIRRELALEEFCAKQTFEIMLLNRLVQQYKHERECNAIIAQKREEKIRRLESLMDGALPTEEFMEEELVSLAHEHELLKENYENHPEVLRTKLELKRVQDELEKYRNFYKLGEREVLMEEIQSLRSQLQLYIDSSSTPARKQYPLLQLTYPSEPSLPSTLDTIPQSTDESSQPNANPESNKESFELRLEQERIQWAEAESRWISISEELKAELEANRALAEKRKQELEAEQKCAEELRDAMHMALEGHARLLEQYADLEEKHIQLLVRHRKIMDGIDDVKKAASRAGVRGAESKFINALAAEISSLKEEREKERRLLRDENRGLQAQLKDTAEAVQAAGELLVRLREAEEAVSSAQKRAMDAEQEAAKAFKQIDKLKRKHEKEINTLNPLTEAGLHKEAMQPTYDDDSYVMPNYVETVEPHSFNGHFEPHNNADDGELSKLAEPSWFSGYDKCNI